MSEAESTNETEPAVDDSPEGKLEALGWSLAHQAEGLVRWVKRFPGEQDIADAFGSSHEVALANAEATEAKNAPVETPEAPAEDAPAPAEAPAADALVAEAPVAEAPAES